MQKGRLSIEHEEWPKIVLVITWPCMPGGIPLRSSTLALLFSKFDANLPPTMVLF